MELVTELLDMLEELEETIEKGFTIPILEKCLIDKAKILDLIKEIRLKLPDDMKQAKWIKDVRLRILSEAEKKTPAVETENKSSKIEEDSPIMKVFPKLEPKAYDPNLEEEVIKRAQEKAVEIKVAAKEYVDGLLHNIEALLEDTSNTLEDTGTKLEGLLDTISLNREELKS